MNQKQKPGKRATHKPPQPAPPPPQGTPTLSLIMLPPKRRLKTPEQTAALQPLKSPVRTHQDLPRCHSVREAGCWSVLKKKLNMERCR